MMDKDNDEIGFGGFFLTNIRKWLIDECLSSGNPSAFFENILEVMDELDEDRSWMSRDEEG